MSEVDRIEVMLLEEEARFKGVSSPTFLGDNLE